MTQEVFLYAPDEKGMQDGRARLNQAGIGFWEDSAMRPIYEAGVIIFVLPMDTAENAAEAVRKLQTVVSMLVPILTVAPGGSLDRFEELAREQISQAPLVAIARSRTSFSSSWETTLDLAKRKLRGN